MSVSSCPTYVSLRRKLCPSPDCEQIQFSDCSEVSDQAMEPTRDVTDQAIADLVEQAVVGPEKAWQRQLVTALMPVWLDDDGDDDDNDGDGDLYIIGAVCVSVSKSHYLCIQRIYFSWWEYFSNLFL